MREITELKSPTCHFIFTAVKTQILNVATIKCQLQSKLVYRSVSLTGLTQFVGLTKTKRYQMYKKAQICNLIILNLSELCLTILSAV